MVDVNVCFIKNEVLTLLMIEKGVTSERNTLKKKRKARSASL